MSELREIIHSITEEPSMSDPAVGIPMRLASVLNEMDEIMCACREHGPIVESELITVGQIKTRCEIILSFFYMRDAGLRVIGRGH